MYAHTTRISVHLVSLRRSENVNCYVVVATLTEGYYYNIDVEKMTCADGTFFYNFPAQ